MIRHRLFVACITSEFLGRDTVLLGDEGYQPFEKPCGVAGDLCHYHGGTAKQRGLKSDIEAIAVPPLQTDRMEVGRFEDIKPDKPVTVGIPSSCFRSPALLP